MKIFICPLDWGLGHATRCIPLARALHQMGHQITLGSNSAGSVLFRRELPHLRCIGMPGYNVRYSKSDFLIGSMLSQVPKIIHAIVKEHVSLKRLVRQGKFDLVISDNRYGLFGGGCPSVILTHQLFIRLPDSRRSRNSLLYRTTEMLVRRILWHFLSRYDQVWIPDYPGEVNLSGELSHGRETPFPVNFIYPLSRFPFGELKTLGRGTGASIQYLAIISGPEPQRTLFEKKVLKQFSRLNGKRMVLLGKPQKKNQDADIQGITTIPHLDGDKFQSILQKSETIVCRPGYTTLMELAAMQKRQIILVPTPGQTEQEYLAARMNRLGIAPFQRQNALDVTDAEARFAKYRGFMGFAPKIKGLSNSIAPLLDKLEPSVFESRKSVT